MIIYYYYLLITMLYLAEIKKLSAKNSQANTSLHMAGAQEI